MIGLKLLRINPQKFKCLRTYTDLSYIHHVGKEPLIPFTLGTVLEMKGKEYADREAIISKYQKRRITYHQLVMEGDKLAAGFRRLGLEKGDRVGIWAPNLIEWIVTMVACARAGFILVAINPGYQANEMKFCINKVGIKSLVCPGKIKNYDFYEILNETCGKLDNENISSKTTPSLKNIIVISDKTLKGTLNYDDILNSAGENEIKSVQKNQDFIQHGDPCNIQFSSGTTGKPKAIVVSHFSTVNNAYQIGIRNELDKKPYKICVQNPLFHAFGLTISSIAALQFGSTLVLPSPFYNSLDNLTAIKEENMLHGTPTMYVDLINLQMKNNLDISPEIALTGGATASPELFKDMKRVLKIKKVKSVYGLTETTASAFQSMVVEDDFEAYETVGHVADHLEVKVVDENNRVVPFGTPGELWVRGYAVMLRYFGDEDKTKEMITDGNWLKTGDKFILERNGYGRIVGRLKDMIIRGGENIFPKEIENLLVTHPAVAEVHVIGLNHARLGEEVCACVRLYEGANLTLESLQEFCKGQLAKFKIPTQLRIIQSFPKTTSGKIQKYLLKKQCENV